MADEDAPADANSKRTFVLIRAGEHTGNELGVFKGREPRQAALKVARRLNPAANETLAKRAPIDIELRERNESHVHVFEAWAWKADPPANPPEWMDDEIVAGDVAKKGIKTTGERETANDRQR